MRKKASYQKKVSLSKKKTAGYYIQVYLVSVLVGVVVFAIGNFLIPSQIPCANSKTCQTDLSVKVDNNTFGMFEGHQVNPPKVDIAQYAQRTSVLGTSDANTNKHIYVDLATQKLYAFDGTTQFMQTLIASGKWGRTPVGNFHIWEKLIATRMAGGEGPDAYDLPNVPYVMYFYNDFGLHGAYWHNNFGHTMSHGCVNMRTIDAHTLYDWADGPVGDKLGTPVSICNSFTPPNTCIQNNPIN